MRIDKYYNSSDPYTPVPGDLMAFWSVAQQAVVGNTLSAVIRDVLGSGDGPWLKYGAVSMSMSDTQASVTFTTPYASPPLLVIPSIAPPSGQPIVGGAIDLGTLTNTGFAFELNVGLPAAGYKFFWISILN